MSAFECSPHAKSFCKYLKSLGIEARIDDDGDVVFREENGSYFATFDEDGPFYFRLVYPNFYEVTPANREHVTELAVRLTGEIKGVKLFEAQGKVWAAVEQFVTDVEHAKRIFKRVKTCLDFAVMSFRAAC
ncbi:MAG: hypothetical protein N2Z21_10145 [Candidatus Sumerlaeaceae bacterium]|nr:hypothetical protein [Candidatus Sumerlaeaceae bacterium]